MFLKIVIILLLSVFLHASPRVVIDSSNTNILDFELEYFVDKVGNMELLDVLEEPFIQTSNKSSLGTGKTHLWLRFQIHNATSSIQKIHLHQNHAYFSNSLEFYALKNQLISNELIIQFNDDTFTQSKEKMYGEKAIFDIVLQKDELKTIYIKNFARSLPYPYLTLHNETYSKKNIVSGNNLLIIIIGILLALCLYNFMLYLTTKYKEYLYYSLYLLSALIWESIVSGMLANSFNIYLTSITDYLLFSIPSAIFFLLLFAKTIFNTAQEYKRENKFLNLALILIIINIIIGLFNITFAAIIITVVAIYAFATLLITSYSIMRKGNEFASIFLFANSFLSLFVFITDLYYAGVIQYSEFAFNAVSIGISIEALILSYLISYRFQQQEIKSRIKDKILFQQSKMATMGEMIENIAHQWRQPLSHINSSVLLIDDYLLSKNTHHKTIEKELLSIENTTKYMSQTIDSFKDFFKDNKVQKTFYLQKTIESTYLLLKNSIKSNNINIDIEANENYQYTGLEDELQQVLLILLNNAIDVFKERNTISPSITIKVLKNDKYYILQISDNAGGIDTKLINEIFKPYFTTKHQAQGTGLGLYISKLIVQENMQGKLSVINDENGASFQVILPLSKI